MIVAVSELVVETFVVPWYTSYPAMLPLLSVDAFQASETLFDVTPVVRRLPGAVGGWVSPLGGVVKATTLLCCEALPAASKAPTDTS